MEYKKYKLWVLTATLVVLWCVAAGVIADRYYVSRMRAVIDEQVLINSERANDLSDSIRRNVHYLGGISEMLSHLIRVHNATALFGTNSVPSAQTYEERKSNWTRNPTLNDLSQYLSVVQSNLNVDLVYLVDAAGDSIASSNWDQPGSPIGKNFADRDFFISNRAGRKGVQYAMGQATHVPGLYFSSPVVTKGHFMGAVVVKIDVSNLSFITNQSDAFITDRNGVIILAHDKHQEMQALPGGAIFGMSNQQKMAQYQRTDFAALSTSSWGSKDFPELIKDAGEAYPQLRMSQPLPELGLTVHVDDDMEQLLPLEREAKLIFLLLAITGSVLIASASGTVWYLNSLKKSKNELFESEERLRITLKSAPDAVVICEQDGCIVYVNDKVIDLLGFSPEELHRMTVFDLIPADWREVYRQGMQQILADDQHHVFEIRWIRKDGGKIPMELNAVMLPNGRVYGSCRDITERKRMESILSESEFRYRTLIESSPLCVHEIDLQGRFTSMNRSGLDMLGIEDESKICGIPFLHAVSESDNERISALFQEAIKGTACHFEFTTAGAAPRYFKSCFIPIRNSHGHVDKLMGLTEDITERKRTDEILQEKEERYRTLVEWIPQAIVVHRAGKFVYANPVATRIFGASSAQDLIGNSILERIHPDFRQIVLDRIKKNATDGLPSTMIDEKYLKLDGTIIDMEVQGTSIVYDGEPAILAVLSDITQRKQADIREQQRLEELEAIYLLSDAVGNAASLERVYEVAMDFMLHLLKADRVAILLFDANGALHFNAWQCISEVYRNALDGHSLWERGAVDPQPFFVEDIQLEPRLSSLRPAITDEGISALGFLPLMQHGRLLGNFMVYFNVPHHFTESEIQLALTISSHVSFAIDHKLAEQQFVDMFEFAPDAIVMTDMDAVITMINRQAGVLFGYPADELVGQTIDILIPQDRSDQRGEQRQRFLASAIRQKSFDITGRRDLRAISKDGRIFPVELSLSQMESPNGKLIAAAVRDVSGRHEVLEELSRTADELVNANIQIEEERARLAVRVLERTSQLLMANKAKDSFLATMSHEIRTPLGGLLGMMELLSLSRLDEKQISMLKVARNSGNSLLRIVDDILDWSKIEAGKLELAPHVANLGEMLKNVVSTYAQLASAKGIQLKQQIDDNLGPAHVFDPLRISQILNNFTSNAIKFTERGCIEIRAERVGATHNGSEEVRFSVKDSGVGIDPEHQSRLFQQYEQASNETARMYGGTGLGLAICRSLAELMGGSLGVESTLGLGTTFFFTVNLPLANLAAQRDLQLRIARDEAHENEPDNSSLGVKVQDMSVLVVDDHPVNRMLLKQQLEQLGLRVELADSGMVGLSLWWTERFNMIITDCHMPEMDGYEFARNIREIEQNEAKPRVPIIAWTANVLAEEEEHCRDAGMDDLLTKPTELSDLRAMLLKWLVKADAIVVPASASSAAPNEAAIDFSVLQKFALGHAGQAEMLQSFSLHNRSDIANLIAVLKEGNPEAVAHSAHRIKGACRMVGALELEGICARIESAAKQDDMQGAQAAAEMKLDDAVARIEAVIGGFVSGTA